MSSSLFELSFFDRADAVVVMVAYFDASEVGGVLSVAGYLFRKKHVRPFERQWRAMLRKHGLEYFHMTDCNATPPQGPFAKLDKAACDDAARLAIAAIKDHATYAFTSAVRVADFNEVMGPKSVMTNPFSLCAYAVMTQCTHWANDHDPKARISYVFEAGDEHQADANKILQSIADIGERRRKYRYENHAFLPKRSSLPTQAADILAWHVAKQCDREQRGIAGMRGDFGALVEGVRTTRNWMSAAWLREFVGLTTRNAPDMVRDPAQLIGLSLRITEENSKTVIREMAALIQDA